MIAVTSSGLVGGVAHLRNVVVPPTDRIAIQSGLGRGGQAKPDLVIFDLATRYLSGFGVLKRLKEQPLTADIAVIIHTWKVLDSEERSAEPHGRSYIQGDGVT